MSQTLRKFVPRASRYVLRPGDSQVLYFTHENEHGRKHATRIVNISSTGIAFLVEKSDAPSIGEHIKIEFPIPGGEQAAWWAKVVRMEAYSDNPWWDSKDSHESHHQVLVGLMYIDLPEGHRKAIQKGLHHRYQELKKQYYLEWARDLKEVLLGNFWKSREEDTVDRIAEDLLVLYDFYICGEELVNAFSIF